MAATAIALVIDVVLQNALDAARVTPGSLTPWWVVGNVPQRSIWFTAAAIVWLLAPPISSWWRQTTADEPRPTRSRPRAFRAVAAAMIVLPLVWIVAANIVRLISITAAGAWAVEGDLFVPPAFYANVLTGYVPWACAGAVLLALSRHLGVAEA